MCEQKTLFTSDREETEKCISFLQNKGYIVSKFTCVGSISGYDPKSVLSFFESEFRQHHPLAVQLKTVQGPSERKAVKLHIESRMALGLTKEQAYKETYELIHLLFESERELGFRTPICSFTFFIAAGCQRVVSLLLERLHSNIIERGSLSVIAGEQYAKEASEDHDKVMRDIGIMLERIRKKRENR